MTVMSLLPIEMVAQEGLFERCITDEAFFGYGSPSGLMSRSEGTTGVYFTSQGFGATGANITGQTFTAPLGSGLFILFVAGASYATIKSKKQNRKGK